MGSNQKGGERHQTQTGQGQGQGHTQSDGRVVEWDWTQSRVERGNGVRPEVTGGSGGKGAVSDLKWGGGAWSRVRPEAGGRGGAGWT